MEYNMKNEGGVRCETGCMARQSTGSSFHIIETSCMLLHSQPIVKLPPCALAWMAYAYEDSLDGHCLGSY